MSKRARDAKRERRRRGRLGSIRMAYEGQQFVPGVGWVDVWRLPPGCIEVTSVYLTLKDIPAPAYGELLEPPHENR